MANGVYYYDGTGRLSAITYNQGYYLDDTLYEQYLDGAMANGIDGFSYTYDDASRVKSLTFDNPDNSAEDATYDYDYDGQLKSADRTGTANDEAYTFDANGNRVHTTDKNTAESTVSSTTIAGNEVSSDGTYTYKYDKNGNRQFRILSGSLYDPETDTYITGIRETTEYKWDYRNRLTEVIVTHFDATDDPGYVVQHDKYTYDVYDRRITEHESNTSGTHTTTYVTQFVYDDGQNVILQLDASGDLTHRYLYGPQPNQLISDDNIGGWNDGQTFWYLADNVGTTRDVVRLGDGDVYTVSDHLVYDSFGNVISETRSVLGDMNNDGKSDDFDISPFEEALANPTDYEAAYPTVSDWQERGDINDDGTFNNFDASPYETLIGSEITKYVGHSFLITYAGMQFDDATGLYYDRAREYNAHTSTFVSVDPANADINTYRYVHNDATGAIDPRGLFTFDNTQFPGYQVVSSTTVPVQLPVPGTGDKIRFSFQEGTALIRFVPKPGTPPNAHSISYIQTKRLWSDYPYGRNCAC